MRQLIIIFLGFCALGYLSSCDNDDYVIIGLTGQEEQIALFEVNNSGIKGTAYFQEREDGATLVRLLLEGTTSGNSHPAHIHVNSAAEGGGTAITLNPVSGNDGMSETVITQTDSGNNISYQELISFDGNINIQKSPAEITTIVARGNIGFNCEGEPNITTCSETPPTDEVCDAFFERWFFNENKCEQIGYSGCSQKGFATKQDCEECKCN